MTDVHLCTCGDCAVDYYDDRCKFEVRAREMIEEIERCDRIHAQAPTVNEAVEYILGLGPKP
jgi:hypothetical protein